MAVQCGKEARKRRGKNPGTRSKKPEAEEELIPYQDWLIRGSNQSNRGCPTLLLLRSGDDLLPLVVHHPLFNIRSLQKFSSTRKGSLGEKANSLSAGTIEFKSLIHMLTQSRRPSHEVSFFLLVSSELPLCLVFYLKRSVGGGSGSDGRDGMHMTNYDYPYL